MNKKDCRFASAKEHNGITYTYNIYPKYRGGVDAKSIMFLSRVHNVTPSSICLLSKTRD
jgi:hypothetical protein